jgi:hypothetical protein
MPHDPTLTLWDNAKHLTVAQCHEHLMRIDAALAKLGPLDPDDPFYRVAAHQRLTKSRDFFERNLARCMRKREGRKYDQRSAS